MGGKLTNVKAENMNDIFNEMLRSMFGFHRRERFPDSFPDNEAPHSRDGFPGDGQFFFFTVPPFGRHSSDASDGFSDPDNTRPNDPFGFGMTDIFGQFRELFEGFGINEFPRHHDKALVPPPPGTGDSETLRDNMLKEPESGSKQNPFFSGIFRVPDIKLQDMYRSPDHQGKSDTDLDEEIRRGNWDAILGPNPSNHTHPEMTEPSQSPGGVLEPRSRGQAFQSFKSVSVSSYRNADGQIEERKTIKDGRGNEETIITRAVGDQRHIVTKRRDHTGAEHVTEQFDNMDERDKDHFTSNWKSQHPPQHNGVPPYGLDPETKSIFKNLFGKSFPGFGWGSDS